MVAPPITQQASSSVMSAFPPMLNSLYPIPSIINEISSYTLLQNNSNNNTNGTNGGDKVPEWFGWVGVSVW